MHGPLCLGCDAVHEVAHAVEEEIVVLLVPVVPIHELEHEARLGHLEDGKGGSEPGETYREATHGDLPCLGGLLLARWGEDQADGPAKLRPDTWLLVGAEGALRGGRALEHLGGRAGLRLDDNGCIWGAGLGSGWVGLDDKARARGVSVR